MFFPECWSQKHGCALYLAKYGGRQAWAWDDVPPTVHVPGGPGLQPTRPGPKACLLKPRALVLAARSTTPREGGRLTSGDGKEVPRVVILLLLLLNKHPKT